FVNKQDRRDEAPCVTVFPYQSGMESFIIQGGRRDPWEQKKHKLDFTSFCETK
ncbi:hypothetical protein STEG23_012133, partial [Scotinomys teguina]